MDLPFQLIQLPQQPLVDVSHRTSILKDLLAHERDLQLVMRLSYPAILTTIGAVVDQNSP
jgi:hypothetical protein